MKLVSYLHQRKALKYFDKTLVRYISTVYQPSDKLLLNKNVTETNKKNTFLN